MKSGITIRQQDIFLVPIPFSDLRAVKKRPVLIISNNFYHREQDDCLVMAITSQIVSGQSYSIVIEKLDLEDGLLPKKSQIRADKVYSVHQNILVRYFGRLSLKKYEEATRKLYQLISNVQATD